MIKLTATVDTNVLVSGIIRDEGSPFILLEYWKTHRFELVTSSELIGELAGVLERAKILKYNIPQSTIKEIIALLYREATICVPTTKLPPVTIRDPKDLIVLGTALSGKVDFLVTGDKDLLSLKHDPKIRTVKIVTVNEFLARIEE